MRKAITLIFILALVVVHVYAQNESTLYFMQSLPQVTNTNPAVVPKYKFSIGFPGSSVFAQYANNGFRYNDLAVNQGDSTVVDMNKLHRALNDKNYVTTAAQADLFRLGFKVNPRIYFTYNLTAKSFNRIMIPKGLIAFFSEGTAAFVGKTTAVSPQVENVEYLESSWGASYVVNPKLTVGANFKLLKGVANVTTVKSNGTITVGNEYQVSAIADIEVKSSGVHNLDSSDYEIEDHWRDYLKNTGFAIDLGATYRLKDRLTLAFSLIDIGAITWKNDLYGYRLDPETANYTFEGINLQSVLDNEGGYLDETKDSLSANFEFQEGVISKYRSPLPGKIYMSANYQIKKNFTVGALLFAERFRGRFSPGFSASLHKEFGRRLSTSLSYTITQQSFNNVGAGISFNFSPIQIYVVGDNLLRAPMAMAADGNLNSFVNSTKFFNLRAGINFVFGWDKSQDKLPHPKKSRTRL
jgi:hypothetical protein